MHYLGIDLGTSAVKVLLCDELGHVLNEASESYLLYRPKDGYSEQNPLDWWESVKKAVLTLVNKNNKDLIKGISFGGQMHGLVALDKNNNVIRPAILWNDGRSEKQSNFLNNEIGKETLVSLTGNFSFPGFTLPKIMWMEENEPELFKKINMILLPKDYIAFRLTGVYSTDYSDASGMLLLDVKNKCWSEKMCEIGHISLSQLPKLFESYEVVGKILPNVAKELNLNEDVLIVAGAGDNAAAAIGTGCVNNGQVNISLGTSGTVFASTDKFVSDNEIPLHSFDHANGKYHLMGCILTAASANQWWIKNILNSDYSTELSMITSADLGHNNVLFAPYLNGERCPHNDVNVRGSFVGLSASTTKKDMVQAIIEGVSFALKDCLELIKAKNINIEKVTLCGGGAKNKIWAEMIADILEVDVSFVETEQGPGYGACILAMVGLGEYKTVEEACKKIIKIKSEINYDKKVSDLYKTQYKKFSKLYAVLKDF